MSRRATARRSAALRERARVYRTTPAGPVVVDASIAVLWFTSEPDRWDARTLLASDARLFAPEMMAVEATNAWWKKLRRGEMDRADVEDAITNLLAVGVTWASSTSLLRSGLQLASDLGHPVYDCLYIALAASHSASLATADDGLRRAARRAGVDIWPG